MLNRKIYFQKEKGTICKIIAPFMLKENKYLQLKYIKPNYRLTEFITTNTTGYHMIRCESDNLEEINKIATKYGIIFIEENTTKDSLKD